MLCRGGQARSGRVKCNCSSCTLRGTTRWRTSENFQVRQKLGKKSDQYDPTKETSCSEEGKADESWRKRLTTTIDVWTAPWTLEQKTAVIQACTKASDGNNAPGMNSDHRMKLNMVTAASESALFSDGHQFHQKTTKQISLPAHHGPLIALVKDFRNTTSCVLDD